ncbi:MAG: hypothetical protein ACTSUR_08995 [Candidatus Heimdallarchaeaceae archaeon]
MITRTIIRKKLKFLAIFSLFYMISLSFFQFAVVSQTENDANLALQTANEKLTEVVTLLEEASEKKIIVIDLTKEADLAREMIFTATENFREENYQLAYEQANEAITKLNQLIVEINERMDSKNRNRVIMFVLLGFFSAIFSIVFLFLFIKKIYPWYKVKQREEYGKLEIIYKDRRSRNHD